MERNLTGIYYRVQRDGKWCSVDFADMTLEEQVNILKDSDKETLIRMCILLVGCIQRLGKEFDIVGE